MLFGDHVEWGSEPAYERVHTHTHNDASTWVT
jgi:hypothetical protein